MHKKKLTILGSTVIIVALLTQSFNYRFQAPPKKLKNIKAFPASMTYNQVDHEMDVFKVAIGVKCNYCHAPSKENPQKLDMSSDENPKKEIARTMIRMTRELNEKYMSVVPHSDTTAVQEITCNTCHRGAAKPIDKIKLEEHHPPFTTPNLGPDAKKNGK
jgi:hypothetical protein